MSLPDPAGRYLAAVCQQAQAWLGSSCKRAEIAAGPVGLAEIKLISQHTPAALAACFGVSSVAPREEDLAPRGRFQACAATAAIGVFLIERGPARDARVRAMAQAVAAGAGAADWLAILRAGIDGPNGAIPADPDFLCSDRAAEVRAANLYAAELASDGIGLWWARWTIDIRIPAPGAVAPPAVPVPSELYASWEPSTGADHLDDYSRLEGSQ